MKNKTKERSRTLAMKKDQEHGGGPGGGSVLEFPLSERAYVMNMDKRIASNTRQMKISGAGATAGAAMMGLMEIQDKKMDKIEKEATKKQIANQEKEYVKRQGGEGSLLLKRIRKAQRDEK